MAQYQKLPESQIWQGLKLSDRPVAFSWELTSRCNHNCRHCYINMPAEHAETKARELSLEEISDIADQAADLGILWCLLTGGEPLLRPDFKEIYLLLKSKGFLLTLFTNATLISPDHIELFKAYPPREIEVSVYGATAKTYEQVTRRAGSFVRFQKALHLLRQNNIPVRLKAMALRSNLHEHAQIADFGRAYTKDYYRFDPFLHLRMDGDPERNKEIVSERLTPQEIVALEKADPARFAQIEHRCCSIESKHHISCDHLFQCGLGLVEFDIRHDGYFRLCSSLDAPGMTLNLRINSLRKAIDHFIPTIRDKRSQSAERLECKTCSIQHLCSWCPALAYLETGELDRRVDYFCEIAHDRAQMVKHKKASVNGLLK